MLFELKNMSGTYLGIMNKIIEGEISDILEVYVDDVIIESNEDHL